MIKHFNLQLLMVSLFLVGTSVANAKLFVPDLEPWNIWEASDERSSIEPNHDEWQQLLDRYLRTTTTDGINRFDYAALKAADSATLDTYLKQLSAIDPRTLRRDRQLPYWINMYNAVTVQVVVKNYPVKSIRKIYGGLFDTGPWDEPVIEIAGQALTLNDIEHRILRPIWRDSRIHYVVNCASLGCPNLAAQAFTAANTEQLMDAAAREFINHPRGVNFDNGRLTLSSIYNWYDTDFGENQRERLTHLQQYAEPELAARLASFEGRIKYDYGWSLNEP
jgi:hypothetical protein